MKRLSYIEDARCLKVKVKPCNALLRMLIVHILRCLKSVLTHTFLILDVCDRDTIFTCRWPATSSVHYTTSCNTQSSAPQDG